MAPPPSASSTAGSRPIPRSSALPTVHEVLPARCCPASRARRLKSQARADGSSHSASPPSPFELGCLPAALIGRADGVALDPCAPHLHTPQILAPPSRDLLPSTTEPSPNACGQESLPDRCKAPPQACAQAGLHFNAYLGSAARHRLSSLPWSSPMMMTSFLNLGRKRMTMTISLKFLCLLTVYLYAIQIIEFELLLCKMNSIKEDAWK